MKKKINKKTVLAAGLTAVAGIASISGVFAQNFFSWITENPLVYDEVYYDTALEQWKAYTYPEDYSNSYWEVIDTHGNEVIPGKFGYISGLGDGLTVYRKDVNSKLGAVDANGNTVIPFEYDDIGGRVGDIVIFARDEKWGAVDLKGNTVIPFEYNYMSVEDGGLITCWKGDVVGMLNASGEVVLPFEYSYAYKLADNMIECSKNSQVGVVDYNGNEILPFEDGYISVINDNLIQRTKDGKAGAYDLNGNVVIPAEYQYFIPYGENRIAACISNFGEESVQALYDAAGNKLFETSGLYIGAFGDDFATYATKDGHYIVNLQTKEEEPFEYYCSDHLENAVVCTNSEGKYGVLDLQKNVILPFEYDSAYMNDKWLECTKNGKSCLIDVQSFTAVTPKYPGYMYEYADGIFAFAGDNKWRFARLEEKELEREKFVMSIGQEASNVWGEYKINDVAPIIRKDRTMLPARFVAENLGAEVAWNGAAQQVIVTKGDTQIALTIGSDEVLVNGESIKIDSPAFIENDRTYTPVRVIAEKLGANVDWNGDTREVIITKN